MINLSILIVNYNVKYYLEQCLRSVRRAVSVPSLSCEVIVVDNASTDDSVGYLSPRFPEVTFVENSENRGFARANNQAIALAKGEVVVLLNPDTVVGEHVFEQVLDFIGRTPKVGGVGVKMINNTGIFLRESKRAYPSPLLSFYKVFGIAALFPNSSHFSRYYLPWLSSQEINRVDILSGAALFIPRSVLDKSGWLDERYFMYGEDIDLSYSITLAGYHNYYLPYTILHYKGESTRKETVLYVNIFYRAMKMFFEKYHPNARYFYRFVITLAIYLRAFLALLHRIFVAPLQKIARLFNSQDNTLSHWIVVTASASEELLFSLSRSDLSPKVELLTPDEFARCAGSIARCAVVFDSDSLPFEEILAIMERIALSQNTFYIYSRQSGALISASDIILLQ